MFHWLYCGRVPSEVAESITVQLPKVYEPEQWGETRPITLSTTFMKLTAQLLLGRAGKAITRDIPWQFSGPEKQPADLILTLRKLVRGSKEWQLPLHIIKLDVTKAFDSTHQETVGTVIQQRLGEAGRHWESRLWLHVIQSRALHVEVSQERIALDQTNGVRQGSPDGPDSPVLFATAIGETLNKVLHAQPGRWVQQCNRPSREAEYHIDGGPLLPHHGGAFQDDIYLWAHSRSLLQHLLMHTERDLKGKGLDIHPGKTQYVYMDEGEQEVEIGGKKVDSAGNPHSNGK